MKRGGDLMQLLRKMLIVAASLPTLMIAAPVAAHASVPIGQAASPAIDQRSCTGQATTPIEFFQTTGPSTICFGGTVGGRSTNFQAFTMHAGGYYGYFTYQQGNKIIVQKFRAGNLIGFGPATVIGVNITPPF
jgi:hypothetical protein